MASLFYARHHHPAGQESKPDDQPEPNAPPSNDSDPKAPPSNVNNSEPRDVPPADGVPPSSNDPGPTKTDYFVPSSALNNPQPTTTQTLGIDTTHAPDPPASSSTIVSTPDSSILTLSTDTLQPTPTVLTNGGALATSSSNKKYIIGGAAGGGVLILILLALLLFCCRKRRAKRDLERSGDGHSEGQPGYGQFACCDHGTCTRNNGQPQMGQKTPLKPFILKSDPAALTPKDGQQPQQQQQHAVSLGRRDSTESQKSAGSDASTCSAYSSDSEGSQRGRRRSQKRPPPLKLTSLVTPVINGPQYNPRNRVNRLSLPNPHEVHPIVVEPPQSETPGRLRVTNPSD